jgi:cell division protein FtsB
MQKYLQRLHIGTLLGVFIAGYLTISLVQTVRNNYHLQQQITGLQQQVTNLQDQRDSLQYQIQYYQTDSFKEKEARSKLGLQAPGEGVVILPHNDSEQSQTQVQSQSTKKHKSNLQQWWDFLTGRA